AVRVRDDGAVRHRQDQLGAVPTVAVVAGAGSPVAGPPVRGAVVVQQRRRRGVDHQPDVAAVPTVAAVWTAERLELLPVHRHAAVTPVAGRDAQHDDVHSLANAVIPPYAVAYGGGYSAAGTTLTPRRPRRVPNSTGPATIAKSVSSPPRPTPTPGWK